MGVSAAIFYAIVIACPIIYGIRQLVLFIIKQVKAHKAWKMEYEEYEETHEKDLYWRVKRKLDEPAERRKREMDNTAYFLEKIKYTIFTFIWGMMFIYDHKGIFGFCFGYMLLLHAFFLIATVIDCKKYRKENHKKWYDN